MATATKVQGYTFEEFCFLIKEDQKADLINGVIYMSPPGTTDEAEVHGRLLRLLHVFAEEYDLGNIYSTRVAFRLAEDQGPEPDLSFVQKDRLHLLRRNYVDGPPDLAVEIVSPESVQRDYKMKWEQYRRAGVREYWIVDHLKQCLTMLRLTRGEAYRKVQPKNGLLWSQVLKGFWLRPEWLWQPRRLEIASFRRGNPQGENSFVLSISGTWGTDLWPL